MLKKNVLALTLIVSASTSACLSEDEKAARRACALEVTGDYSEVRQDGVAVGTLVVENQTDKNDVKLTYTRGALYDGESAFLDRLADPADKAALTESVVLGEGPNEFRVNKAGGENVSTDFGRSSEIEVDGVDHEAVTSDEEGAEDAKLRYAIALTIDNGSDELKGSLTLTFSEQRPSSANNADDRPATTQLHTEKETFPVVFKRESVLQSVQSPECKAVVDGE